MDTNLHRHPPSHPSGQLTRIYNAQERAVIDVFKAQYLEATSPAERKMIAQVHILPALFNHWISVGQVVGDKEMKLRTVELISWLRNVWRPTKKFALTKGNRYRLTDVLWWTRQASVFKEIASIMNLDSADTNTPGWFPYRTIAAKNLLDNMTDVERAKLIDEAGKLVSEGLPADLQYTRFAEEKWHSRFSKTAREHYGEMGLVSISVVVYTRKSGQTAIEIHDNIAGILSVPAKPFEDTYTDKAI
ncbi:hypothetical protein BYT27DRAFT_7113986 [Phlegmacium glaucopus]|nr:hypothetical protein BYT27DRAFT_7113986 [Phlegmacium glaucopus]